MPGTADPARPSEGRDISCHSMSKGIYRCWWEGQFRHVSTRLMGYCPFTWRPSRNVPSRRSPRRPLRRDDSTVCRERRRAIDVEIEIGGSYSPQAEIESGVRDEHFGEGRVPHDGQREFERVPTSRDSVLREDDNLCYSIW